MTKMSNKKFKNIALRLTAEELIEKRERAARGKLRGYTRAKQRERKKSFTK